LVICRSNPFIMLSMLLFLWISFLSSDLFSAGIEPYSYLQQIITLD
jgi:hypothetical protein